MAAETAANGPTAGAYIQHHLHHLQKNFSFETVTQKDIHIQNLTALVELLEAEGLRERFVLICGGARITHELAKELGYDAGFGAKKYAEDVASFAVNELVRRGVK